MILAQLYCGREVARLFLFLFGLGQAPQPCLVQTLQGKCGESVKLLASQASHARVSFKYFKFGLEYKVVADKTQQPKNELAVSTLSVLDSPVFCFFPPKIQSVLSAAVICSNFSGVFKMI